MTNDLSKKSPGGASQWAAALLRWAVILAVAGVMFVLVWRMNRPHRQISNQPLSKLKLTYVTGAAETQTSDVISLADLKGQVVLINYWGTWCGPCRIEFPHLIALENKLRSHQDFRLLLVSCEGATGTSFETLKSQTEQFLKEYKYRSAVYCDPTGESRNALARSAGLNQVNYPTTVLLDRQGMIQGLWEGYSPSAIEDIESRTKALLAEGT